MTEQSTSEKRLLLGKTNFLGWYKYTISELIDNDMATLNTTTGLLEITPQKLKEAKLLLKRTLSFSVMTNAPMEQDVITILNYFKKKYGYINRFDAKDAIENHKMTNINPHQFLDKFDELATAITISGGKLTIEEKYILILKNINQVFYAPFIRDGRKTGLKFGTIKG